MKITRKDSAAAPVAVPGFGKVAQGETIEVEETQARALLAGGRFEPAGDHRSTRKITPAPSGSEE